MGGGSSGNKPAPLLAPQKFVGTQKLTNDQQTRIQEDLVDRERQAAALASAGMVAENVNYTKPGGIGQVLQAPPPLVGIAPPASNPSSSNNRNHSHNHNDIAMEAINWNNINDLGNPDDMDMDFAAMFDAEQEQTFAGNGQPSPLEPKSTGSSGIPNPLNTKVL